jgi:hypothetical protein
MVRKTLKAAPQKHELLIWIATSCIVVRGNVGSLPGWCARRTWSPLCPGDRTACLREIAEAALVHLVRHSS